MDLDLKKVFERISEIVDVVYITNTESDTYVSLKDNERFREIFGTTGSYRKMMNIFMENTAGKAITDSKQYSVFLQESGSFKDRFSKNVKMRIGENEFFYHMSNYCLDDKNSALLITETDESEYILETHGDEKANVIRSAYLFSMVVDLVSDKCSSMDMSETSDNPLNELDIAFSQWRTIILNMIHPDFHEKFTSHTEPEYLKSCLKDNITTSFECLMANLDGEFIWVKLIFNRVDTGNSEDFTLLFIVENIHDSHMRIINELRKYEEKANCDSLTALYNHGRIESELSSALSKCRSEGKPISLIMFDIDHFKRVNDIFGHAAGDYVLKTLSKTADEYLSSCGCVLGRWGGEEFLGVCAGVNEDDMYSTAEELRKKIESLEFETVGHITSSFGVISVKENETAAEAFERIDKALYDAKHGGRNRVVIG